MVVDVGEGLAHYARISLIPKVAVFTTGKRPSSNNTNGGMTVTHVHLFFDQPGWKCLRAVFLGGGRFSDARQKVGEANFGTVSGGNV